MNKRLLIGFFTSFILSLISVNLMTATASAKTNYVEGSDAASVIFDPTKVTQFDLSMSDSDFESLKYPNVQWDQEGPWLDTQMRFTMNKKTYGPYRVGVHLKGAWGSWRDVTQKAAFKIKMDAFVPKQRLFGLTKITLNNMVQDATYIHEAITYRLMRAVGIPAPRTGYSDVTLNGIDYGLHLNVETVDRTMLKRWGLSSKHMYKGAVPTFPDLTTDSLGGFVTESGDPTDTSDLKDLVAINQLSGDEWWAAISKSANIREFLLEWAAEMTTAHWDGYTDNKNNYFVNFDDQGQATLLPWGTDQTWNGALDYFNMAAIMPRLCMAVTACQEDYLQALARVSAKAQSLNLYQMAQDLIPEISPWITTDTMGYGLQTSIDYQNDFFQKLDTQLTTLQSMVTPWDATLKSVNVNGKNFSPDNTIYLAPKTTRAIIRPTPNNPDATVTNQNVRLATGLNTIQVSTTSADGQHVYDSPANIYVLTKRESTLKLNFIKNSKQLSASSTTALNALIVKLQDAQNISIKTTTSSSVSSLIGTLRFTTIRAAFISIGGVKFAKGSSAISKDSLILSVTYFN